MEKDHLAVCLDYFQNDTEAFMNQIKPPSPPPRPEDPNKPLSPPPPPIPPRPSFIVHLGTALFQSIPRQDHQWTSTVRTHQFAFENDRRGERVERRDNPPLPQAFPLFINRAPSFEYRPSC